jgi:hypothetical protein
MKKLIILTIFSIFFTTGCSFLPKLTFNNPSSVPQQTEKSKAKETCKGQATFNDNGEMSSCTKGYVNYAENKEVKERRYSFFERIGNFFANLKGWFGILIILSIVLIFMGFGGLVSTVWMNIFGVASKGVKALVKGIQNGKNYVRNNGTKYSEQERIIYNQGANDMLQKISEATDDKEVKKLINLLRVE